jgi:hypothetical protein
LYLFLLILNLASSVLVLPASEGVGLVAGSIVHVLGVQMASLALNVSLLWCLGRAFARWLAKPIQPSRR